MKITSGIVRNAQASCLVENQAVVICAVFFKEKTENEDFVSLRTSFLCEGGGEELCELEKIAEGMFDGPLPKLRAAIDVVVLGGDSPFCDCVNAVSICLVQCGIPLKDTFSCAEGRSAGSSATLVLGTFTDRVLHFHCRGPQLKAALDAARERCLSNFGEIREHIRQILPAGLMDGETPDPELRAP